MTHRNALGCAANRVCFEMLPIGTRSFEHRRTLLLHSRKGCLTLQPTMRPKKPLGARSEMLTVDASDKVYETTKLGAVFDMLASHGVAADSILRDVNIPLADIHSPRARISLTQLI